MAQPEWEDRTIREMLERSVGPEAAGEIMKEVNDAYASGKRGEELFECFKKAVESKGKTVPTDKSDILYGFLLPADI